IDDIHLAIAHPRDGKVLVAYTGKHWSIDQIESLKNVGLDIIIGSALSLIWNPKAENSEWLIAEYDQQVHVQYGPDLGFSAPLAQTGLALQLLIAERKPDSIVLRAKDAHALNDLEKRLPAEWQALPRKTEIKEWC